jgi:hypothetical protein
MVEFLASEISCLSGECYRDSLSKFPIGTYSPATESRKKKVMGFDLNREGVSFPFLKPDPAHRLSGTADPNVFCLLTTHKVRRKNLGDHPDGSIN